MPTLYDQWLLDQADDHMESEWEEEDSEEDDDDDYERE